MDHKEYPILEFDEAKRAVIEPSEAYKLIEISEYCVICFHKKIVEKVASTSGVKIVFDIKGVFGPVPIYQFEHNGRPIAFFNPLVGAPAASAFLEIAIALGCRKFVVCGSAGVLDQGIPVGGFIVPKAAIRDEGVSYHYVLPGRQIETSQRAIEAITATLDVHGETYDTAKIWTTDAVFRETPSRVKLRKEEGCIAVDMEAAALMTVAQFRNVELGYIVCGGDDVSGDEWDRRGEMVRTPIAEKLFWLSVEACQRM